MKNELGVFKHGSLNGMKRLLVVGHAYLVPLNQDKWIAFADLHPEVEVQVIFPHRWPDVLCTLEGIVSKPRSNCTFTPLQAFKVGNEVRYGFYPAALISLLSRFAPDKIYVEQGDNAFSYFQIISFAKIWAPRAKFAFFSWVNWKPIWSLKYKIMWKWLERLNLACSQGAILGNHDAQKLLKEKGFKSTTMVLPQLGVDLEPVTKEVRACKKRIYFVGRLAEEKGIFLLYQAFVNLQPRYPDWTLHFVGTGPAEQRLKNSAMHNSSVVFHGSVAHSEVFNLLKEASIFALPSYDTPLWREQFGHVLIEAMALSVPVIGTNGGEIAQVIGDAGLVAEQNDTVSLQRCLDLLMNNELLRKDFGQRGYKRVESNFTHHVIAEKTYQFLNNL